MKKLIALLVFVTLLLSGCGATETEEVPAGNNSADDTWAAVKDAYVYAFPLVLMDATKASATNTETAGPNKAPVNQFIHRDTLADPQAKNVVSPNVDTIYSQVWYDLSKEPIIHVLPETDRFCKVQVLDGWTNTSAVLDKAGTYAITVSSWEGSLPDGVIRVDVPTSMAWSITRTVLSGEEDLPAVYAIQSKMQIMPLSAYISGTNYQAPQGSYSEENDFVPIQKVLSMGPAEFFDKANDLMKSNPPAEGDKAMLEKIAAVNVGPNKRFDISVLTGDVAAQWKDMLTGLRPMLVAEGSKFSVKMDQWSYFGRPIGDFGTEYGYRAMVALGGLGANTLDVAMYTQTNTDETGAQMNGSHTYKIHFDSFPPVLDNGFWSLTAYGSDDFLIDNPLNRYCINDRSSFELNEDRTLDIIVSAAEPENTSNWLPVNEDDFHLYMRIYTPNMDAIATWSAPVITLID